MYTINFEKPIHIHFIGIGGISMSGLAEILLEEGFTISGSDSRESDLTRRLADSGAHIIYGQSAANITDDIDVVVYTAAIHPDNPEFTYASVKGLPMLTRAQLLGQIMKNYQIPIAVSGTHGKKRDDCYVAGRRTRQQARSFDFEGGETSRGIWREIPNYRFSVK